MQKIDRFTASLDFWYRETLQYQSLKPFIDLHESVMESGK